MSEREPSVGDTFWTRGEDGADESNEIEEVCETQPDGVFTVASDGDFYDIIWNEKLSRWDEDGGEEE